MQPNESNEKKLVLSLGSNLGNRYTYLKQAVETIEQRLGAKATVAHFYETPPWGEVHQARFLNTVLYLEVNYDVEETHRILKEIEVQLGKTKVRKWGPRCIDIDILFWGEEEVNSAELQIPHLHLHERAFVLRPLADVLPSFVHPVFKKSPGDMLQLIKDDTTVFCKSE